MSSVVEPLCDRCGYDAAVVDFELLADGRWRCSNCGSITGDPDGGQVDEA